MKGHEVNCIMSVIQIAPRSIMSVIQIASAHTAPRHEANCIMSVIQIAQLVYYN